MPSMPPMPRVIETTNADGTATFAVEFQARTEPLPDGWHSSVGASDRCHVENLYYKYKEGIERPDLLVGLGGDIVFLFDELARELALHNVSLIQAIEIIVGRFRENGFDVIPGEIIITPEGIWKFREWRLEKRGGDPVHDPEPGR
jgi:hypothetical protein